MNETIKTIFIFVIGFAIGIIAYILIRWLANRANKNRMGTDNNVIKQITDGIGDAKSSTGTIGSGIENATESAGKIRDTSTALADVIRRIEERQQGFKQ